MHQLLRRINPSVFAFFLLTISMFQIGYLWYAIVESKSLSYKEYLINKEKFSKSLHITASYALPQGKDFEMTKHLAEAMELGEIHFCLLTKNGKDIFSCSVNGEESIDFPEKVPDGTNRRRDVEIETSNIGPYTLHTGFKRSSDYYSDHFIENIRSEAVREFIIYVIISLIPFMIIIYQLRNLNRKFQSPGLKRGNPVDAVFSDFTSLFRGLGAYEDEIDELRTYKNLYLEHVSSALQHEIHLKGNPPYNRQVVLVRTDINGFSKIFQKQDLQEPFQRLINSYFKDLKNVLSRYSGYHHETIGDEAVYIFKDIDHQNPVAIAISAIRGIHALADQYSEISLKEIGYPFVVKSSLSFGELRFGEVVDTLGFSGIPFIESNRLLSHVDDKSQNALVLNIELAKKAETICSTKNLRTVSVRSFEKPMQICDYNTHFPVSTFLKTTLSNHEEYLIYYRNDHDICEILRFLKNSWQTMPHARVKSILKVFESYRASSRSPDVRTSLIDLLTDIYLAGLKNMKRETLEILSSAISKTRHLLAKEIYSDELQNLLLEFLMIDERRIISNTLEVFAEFGVKEQPRVFSSLRKNKDNRVAAALAILTFKSGSKSETNRRLRQMLNSRNPLFIASGLFALGEIAKESIASDRASFATNDFLQKYLGKISKYLISPNQMVRRQAMIAAKKSERLDTLRDLIDAKNKPITTEIREEAENFLMSCKNIQ